MKRRPHEPPGKDYFATTRWTMVLAAGDRTPRAGQALAELCQTYWVPLYTYLRKKGHQPASAEDIVQAFLARLIEKASLAAADPNRGRFRSFLISSLQNFVAHLRDQELAQKRGGNLRKFSLDFSTAEEAYHREPWTDLTPEKIFDRQWAIDLLNLVLSRLADEYAKSGKARLFARLRPALTGDAPGVGYAEIASEFQLSADAVKMAVSRLRKRYRELLRRPLPRHKTLTTSFGTCSRRFRVDFRRPALRWFPLHRGFFMDSNLALPVPPDTTQRRRKSDSTGETSVEYRSHGK